MAIWEPKVEAGGRDTLSYVEREGDALPILFVHGSGFCKEVFRNQFAGRTLAGHRLLALDLPGHGQSADAGDPNATYSYAGFADAVAGFIKRLGINRCVVVGWSLGGHVAFDLLDAVPTVAGVMAFGAPPSVGGPLGIIRTLHISRTLLLVSKAKFSSADAERFERICLDGHCSGEFVEPLMRTDVKMRPNLSRSVMRSFGPGQKERVENTHTPVCLLHGRHDPIVHAGYMQALRGPGLFGGRTFVFEKAGHAPFIDSAKEFDSLLKEFVDAVDFGRALPGSGADPRYAIAS